MMPNCKKKKKKKLSEKNVYDMWTGKGATMSRSITPFQGAVQVRVVGNPTSLWKAMLLDI